MRLSSAAFSQAVQTDNYIQSHPERQNRLCLRLLHEECSIKNNTLTGMDNNPPSTLPPAGSPVSSTSQRWYRGVTAYQRLILVIASAGFVYAMQLRKKGAARRTTAFGQIGMPLPPIPARPTGASLPPLPW